MRSIRIAGELTRLRSQYVSFTLDDRRAYSVFMLLEALRGPSCYRGLADGSHGEKNEMFLLICQLINS
jgi:hypothetical protein